MNCLKMLLHIYNINKLKHHLPEDKNVLFAFPRATIATPIGTTKAAFPRTFTPQICRITIYMIGIN